MATQWQRGLEAEGGGLCNSQRGAYWGLSKGSAHSDSSPGSTCLWKVPIPLQQFQFEETEALREDMETLEGLRTTAQGAHYDVTCTLRIELCGAQASFKERFP